MDKKMVNVMMKVAMNKKVKNRARTKVARKSRRMNRLRKK